MTVSPDPSRLLASAALDNEVTPDERAEVNASASLTAEVAVYRALRRDLADVDVPADARETGIAAALAVFDAATIADSPTVTQLLDPQLLDPQLLHTATDSNVRSMQSLRRRQFRWVGGVAAAAIVAVLGIVVVNGSNSNGKRLSSSTPEPAPHVGIPNTSEKSSDQSGKQSDSTSAVDAASGGAQSGPGADSVNGTNVTTGSATAATVTAGTTAVAPNAGSATAPAIGTDPWTNAPSFDGAAALAAFAFAPGSPLSQTTESATPNQAGAPASTHPSAGSTAGSTPDPTAGSTAASTATATASTPASPVFVTTTSTFGVSATTAAASATTTAAGAVTPPPPPPPPPQPVASILTERAAAVCDTGGRPTIAAIYIGKRVIIVRDDATNQLQILDPQTCAITSTIAVP